MAATVGQRNFERTAMGRFSSGRFALLPWTKQMFTALWEQLLVIVNVIYYTLISVFQMFRLEVHVRITDETGQHIQHMTTAANPAESFLFSSLFDGDNGVMVGGAKPLSNFCADIDESFAGKSTAEALLSSLRADDLCCGLVDDFVSRATAADDGLFRAHHSGWKMGFPGDWNIFVSSSDSSGSSDSCRTSSERAFKPDVSNMANIVGQGSSEEDRSSPWSSEEDQSVEFDSEESKALWESLSKSSDPYNPFFFTAHLSTDTGKSESEVKDCGRDAVRVSQGPGAWVSRSDSESSWSGSDGSNQDADEANERLLELFSIPDPYHPMCFTACRVSGASSPSAAAPKPRASLPAPPPGAGREAREGRGSSVPAAPEDDDDEEERLWRSLCSKNDPYCRPLRRG